MKKLELTYKSIRKSITDLEQLLNNINSELKFPEEKFANLQIAVSEAILNAIIHGNKENPEKNIFVKIEYDENKISIRIKDEGSGFDINKLPDPTKEENLYKEHGRGILIIKSIVDIFDCISDTNGTEIVMTILK